jgi:hypothetical protein
MNQDLKEADKLKWYLGLGGTGIGILLALLSGRR